VFGTRKLFLQKKLPLLLVPKVPKVVLVLLHLFSLTTRRTLTLEMLVSCKVSVRDLGCDLVAKSMSEIEQAKSRW
jgi:hypothetical protein